jgi:high-affinity iron transporter
MRVALALAVLSVAAARAETPRGSWQRLVAILQYLQSDYPDAVRSQTPSELEEQRGFAREAVAQLVALGPAGEPFRVQLEALAKRVEQGQDPQGVSQDCARLVDALVVAGGLSRSPRAPPDLERGRSLYASACAACHAVDGSAQVEIAPTMTPRPARFLDAQVMDALTPYKAFNVTSLGVTGTAMPSYELYDDKDRWALSFYVFTLRQPPCTGRTPRVTLEALANATDPELAKDYTPEQIACLRRQPPRVDEERSLLVARGGIDEAMRLSAQGNASAARAAVMDAYLNGIEPVEPLLKGRSPELVRQLEEGFTALRLDAETGGPRMEADARALLGVIDRARRNASPTDVWSVFIATLLILLREGLEATVVIAALLAVLKKTGQTSHARVVHLGWILALGLGIAAFVFARHLLAGTNREWMEAVVALAAVAMLVYAALWLNARANIRKLMGRLREQMTGALGRGSAVGLFTISFTAMARESFETALFLQGLSLDSPRGVAWGAVAGAVALVALVTFIIRVGYRLPMKALFNGSTVLLFATAVILLGKGLHALQELGTLGVHPVRFPTIDFLGIYPDWLSLLPQALLAVAPLVYWLFRTGGEAPPPAVPAVDGG